MGLWRRGQRGSSPAGGEVGLWEPRRWGELLASMAPTWWLAPEEQGRLMTLAQGFLAHKRLEPVGGLLLDDRMRLMLAAQACLPVLNLGLEWLDNWRSVILYPDTFIPEYVAHYQPLDAAGAVVVPGPHSGQSWPNGPVILSWADIERDLATREGYGVNVVIHEVCHQLDVRSGGFDGMPPLPGDIARGAWVREFTAAFRHLRQVVEEEREEPPLDPYAAESPAEFFAVAVEGFFIVPEWLREDYPGVYALLCRYFRQDPIARMAAHPGFQGPGEGRGE